MRVFPAQTLPRSRSTHPTSPRPRSAWCSSCRWTTTIFAQPLYVPGVAIAGQGTHNVVYVATMSDSLYAFDADTGVKLWSVNFASSVGATPVPYAQFAFAGNRNVVGNLGILSTPVIDPSTNILYLVACTLESSTMVYRLHAVNITSGAEPIVPVAR